jgi:hypothetical protein
MTTFSSLLQAGAAGAAATGLLYTAAVAAVALTAVVSRSAARRRDARETLKVLLSKDNRQAGTATRRRRRG